MKDRTEMQVQTAYFFLKKINTKTEMLLKPQMWF